MQGKTTGESMRYKIYPEEKGGLEALNQKALVASLLKCSFIAIFLYNKVMRKLQSSVKGWLMESS